jgi:hypothetical protein
MPGGDGTGPIGRGPMTGRAIGFCAGYSTPGYANPVYRRGLGRGFGRGIGRGFWSRGRGFWWRGEYPEFPSRNIYRNQSREEEKKYLEEMIIDLEQEIKDIRSRIQEISKEKKESP